MENLHMTPYQQYISISRYARYLPEKTRRETWKETVGRYCNFFADRSSLFPTEEAFSAISNLEVMPSMRALMTAGKALARDNVAGFNCSYIAVDDVRAFDEALYVLLNGTGLGFSVERQFICHLPEVAEVFFESDSVIKVRDSKIGWATAFRELIGMLYGGKIPKWDMSAVRPAGAPLKTFGGRASGPAPLADLFNFTVKVFKKAAGRRLNSVECHDLLCKIAEVVVVGGVRRAALISLSNLSDDRMRHAKTGQWWIDESQRALSNNSAAYTEKPSISQFMTEWLSLYESKSGERGIMNRVAAKRKVKTLGDRRKSDYDFGINPCGEILLRPQEFCNLTEVVVRENDTLEDLKRKVEMATILGTFQSAVTDFRYLRSIWKRNVDEERLLGVSLTGVMDHPLLSLVSDETKRWLIELRQHAVVVNKEWAAKLGINPSAAITTCKPSGTVSQLVDSSSGIHPRMSRFYIRTVRNDKKDPISDFLIQQGVPHETDLTSDSTWVFSFPIKSPSNARIASDMTALDQLEHYMMYNEHWAEHSPSITVYVREHEWLDVAAWVYKNFDAINGMSFLPYSDSVYKQAPYQPITEEEYNELMKTFPDFDFGDYNVNEYEDNTVASQTLACSSGGCEI
jgi:ribonucleoside-diphosphate reductase alpha chain